MKRQFGLWLPLVGLFLLSFVSVATLTLIAAPPILTILTTVAAVAVYSVAAWSFAFRKLGER